MGGARRAQRGRGERGARRLVAAAQGSTRYSFEHRVQTGTECLSAKRTAHTWLARLSSGEEIEASEYVFRTSTQIETAVPDLDWLNKGVFISVAGRQPRGVIYEVYLVA